MSRLFVTTITLYSTVNHADLEGNDTRTFQEIANDENDGTTFVDGMRVKPVFLHSVPEGVLSAFNLLEASFEVTACCASYAAGNGCSDDCPVGCVGPEGDEGYYTNPIPPIPTEGGEQG